MAELTRWVVNSHVAAVVCTHKDLVKVGQQWSSETPLLALASRLEVQSGEAELEAALGPLVEQALATR